MMWIARRLACRHSPSFCFRSLVLSSPEMGNSYYQSHFSISLLILSGFFGVCGFTSYFHHNVVECLEPDAPGVTANLPFYTREEVAKHTSLSTGIWTTFGNGVYDITGFVENHPGGSDKVVLAAGGRLEHYWNLYRQHYASAAPREHLSKMCIGRVHPDDLKVDKDKFDDMKDPFSLDPEVSPVLRCFVKKPVNAEPPGPLLTHSFLTPNDIFFIRNHHPVPRELASKNFDIDEDKYMITVDIAGSSDGRRPPRSVRLSLTDLKTKFRRREVVASLQCGGNRREELSNLEQTAGKNVRLLN